MSEDWVYYALGEHLRSSGDNVAPIIPHVERILYALVDTGLITETEVRHSKENFIRKRTLRDLCNKHPETVKRRVMQFRLTGR
jgi:hypothetical protein